MNKDLKKSKINLSKLINHLIAIKKLNNYPLISSNLELETEQNRDLRSLLLNFYALENPIDDFSFSKSDLFFLADEILWFILIEFFKYENCNIVSYMKNHQGYNHFLFSVVKKSEIHFNDRFYKTERLDCFIDLLRATNILKINGQYEFVNLDKMESLLNFELESKKTDFLKGICE